MTLLAIAAAAATGIYASLWLFLFLINSLDGRRTPGALVAALAVVGLALLTLV